MSERFSELIRFEAIVFVFKSNENLKVITHGSSRNSLIFPSLLHNSSKIIGQEKNVPRFLVFTTFYNFHTQHFSEKLTAENRCNFVETTLTSFGKSQNSETSCYNNLHCISRRFFFCFPLWNV